MSVPLFMLAFCHALTEVVSRRVKAWGASRNLAFVRRSGSYRAFFFSHNDPWLDTPNAWTACKSAVHCIRFTGYDHKKGARCAGRSAAALFPLLKAALAESVLACEFILRHAYFFSDGFDIDCGRNMHGVTVTRALGEGQCFVRPLRGALSRSGHGR